MGSVDENILRTAKEIVVKFIETGRISPTGFNESFKAVYKSIEEAVKGTGNAAGKDEENLTR